MLLMLTRVLFAALLFVSSVMADSFQLGQFTVEYTHGPGVVILGPQPIVSQQKVFSLRILHSQDTGKCLWQSLF